MSKLTVHEDKPAEQKQAIDGAGVVKDSRGRVIKIRELDAVQEARVFCSAGAEDAVNMPYMNMYVFPAAKVESIDGENYSVPTNKMQINGMLSILGKDGLNAVQKFMFDEMDAKKASQIDDAAAKN